MLFRLDIIKEITKIKELLYLNSPIFMSMTLSFNAKIVWNFVSLQVWHFTSCKKLYDTLHHFASLTQNVWHKKYGPIWYHRVSPKISNDIVENLDLLCNFEYSEQAQSSEDGEAEWTGLWHQVCPDHLEHAGQDDDAVEEVEGGLEVDPGAKGVHTHNHLSDEQAQEHELGIIWKIGSIGHQTRAILLGGVLVLDDIGVLLKIGIGIGYC